MSVHTNQSQQEAHVRHVQTNACTPTILVFSPMVPFCHSRRIKMRSRLPAARNTPEWRHSKHPSVLDQPCPRRLSLHHVPPPSMCQPNSNRPVGTSCHMHGKECQACGQTKSPGMAPTNRPHVCWHDPLCQTISTTWLAFCGSGLTKAV